MAWGLAGMSQASTASVNNYDKRYYLSDIACRFHVRRVTCPGEIGTPETVQLALTRVQGLGFVVACAGLANGTPRNHAHEGAQ